MATSFVGQAAASATSVTLPVHQAGDLIVAWAFNEGSTTAPTLPAGWTDINSGSTTSCASRCGYIVAAAPGTSSGTWTNATEVCFEIYRGTRGIGGNSVNGAVTSSAVNYLAIALTIADGSSWVAAFAGHKSTDTNLQNAPTGMTNRSNIVDAVGEIAGHDTNGGVSSWSDTVVNVGGTANHWRSQTVEILARRDIVLTAAQGNYAIAGLAAQVLGPKGKAGAAAPLPSLGLILQANAAYTLAAAQGSYSASGQANNLRYGRLVLAAAQGAYSVSGQAAAFSISVRGQSGAPAPLPHLGLLLGPMRLLTAIQGAYSVTGQAAGLSKGYKVTAAVGSYTILGSTSQSDFQMTSAQGAYTVTGQAVTFLRGYRVIAAQGFYNLAGQSTTSLVASHASLVANASSYGIAGQVAGMRAGRRITAAGGNATISGQAAALRRARSLVAASGVYAETGNAANLIYSTQTAFVLTAQAGSYGQSGISARLFAARRVYPASGAISLSGQSSGLASQRRLAAAAANYAVAGSDALMNHAVRSLTADVGFYAMVGGDVSFLAPLPALIAGVGVIFLTGGDVVMRVGTTVDPSESRTVYVAAESRLVYMPVQ